MKIVLATGGFDPIHSGHIKYFKDAKALGDKLIVGLNSDEWLARKKGQPFMPYSERYSIVDELKIVDEVIQYDDSDGSSKNAIRLVRSLYPDATIIFVNGGDRDNTNIPEMDVDVDNIEFVFGVGGSFKKNSSSWILKEWKQRKTKRPWGYYRILHEVEGCKVKELTVEPGQSLSMQRHFKRNEFWLVSKGSCSLSSMMSNGYMLPVKELDIHMSAYIPQGDWHQLSNPYDLPCQIVEIQYGSDCIEDDIERKE